MAGQVFQHLLFRGPSVVARELVRSADVLIVFNSARLTYEILPALAGLVHLVSFLATVLNLRCPEDPSPANGTSIPVS